MHHRSKILALALAALAPCAWASGFAVQNQAGSGNGNAFSGAAAAADDASTIYFNPAGMTLLGDGHNISLAGTVLSRSLEFSDHGSTGTGLATLPNPRSNGGNAGGASLIPAGYWAYALSKQWSVGVGVSPTFGNRTEYSFNFVGRDAGYFAELTQININPSLAYKVSDAVALGFGVNLAYNETHFKQGFPLEGLSPNNFVDLKGDGIAWGYNLGAMFQLSPATRLGAAYRSELRFELQGKYDVQTPVPAAAFVDQTIRAVLKTPANASLALSHRVNDRLELLADATWTDWSVVDNLDVINGSSGARVTRLSYNFKDTMRYGLGANYQYNDQWKLRFGVAYDETPVKTPADRTMTLPDSNRSWLSFGGRYALSKASSIDLGYSHVFFAGATTNRVAYSGAFGVQTIRGGFNTSAELLSLQYNQRF